MSLGTKEGKVVFYRISSTQNKKLCESKGGLSYGSITAIDCTLGGEKVVATNESGEILTFNLHDFLERE